MYEAMVNFLAELYMLKRNQREGWRLIAAPPDSLADHIAVTAQLAYLIGELEGLNPERCATIALFHDNGEARVTDHHRISKYYVRKDDGEATAMVEQFSRLPDNLGSRLAGLVRQLEDRSTPEGIVAKDADNLEFALQAKIFSELGHVEAKRMFERTRPRLQTKTALALFDAVAATPDFTNCWYQGLVAKSKS